MTSRYISIFSATVVGVLSAVAVLGGLASISSAAGGGPTVVLTSTSASSTSSTTIPVTATFSQSVNGLMSSNVTATNATVGTVSGSGSVYTFNLTPTAAGTVTVMIGADMASSTASSTGSQVSNTLTFTYTPATTTGTTTAFLALSTYSGPPGTSVNAIGTNFTSGEQVSLAIPGLATTTVSADVSGNFTSPFFVPMVPMGAITLSATGQTSGRMATNSFFVQDASSTSTSTASTTPLAHTGVDTVRSNAIADGSFVNGWEWVLHLTVPDNETYFALKFNDFTSGSSSSTIPAMNNIRVWTGQSSNASTSASSMVASGNNYSSAMTLTGDTSSTTAGRQVDVHVQVAVPFGTPAGSYSTMFGALSTTTPF